MLKKFIFYIKEKINFISFFKNENKFIFSYRQINGILAIFFISNTIVFLLGYFCGYKKAIKLFVAKLEEESFADRINYALYTMNNKDSNDAEVDLDQDVETENEDEDNDQIQEDSDQESLNENNKQSLENTENNTFTQNNFFAPIAGFSSLQKAEIFLKKIKKIDPQAVIQKKISRNKEGKTITWYQAITGEFSSNDLLEKVIMRLKKEAHIAHNQNIVIMQKRKV